MVHRPTASADFVCHMEDVLEVYHRPFNPQRPVVCLDETTKQLVSETRTPLPAAAGRPVSYDYEYGVASVSVWERERAVCESGFDGF